MTPPEVLRKRWVALLFIALIIDITPTGALLAALSIDLGSQFMKIGLVKPGVPMEIVLNRESHRKTASIVGIRNGERSFSDPAAQLAVKFPKFAYSYLMDLLGKKLDNPIVQLFHKRFPQYKLAADHNRGTVVFEANENESYSVEELIAMLLSDARMVAEKFAEQTVKDVVITVPAFFNQAERRAMVNAATIAGLKPLQLMNDNTASGLNYGAFRRNLFNETATSVLIYDMGATKTTATIFQYQLIKEKYDKNPQMTVLGVGYDRTLGGIDMTLRLRDHLLGLFRKQHKTQQDITETPRSMAKLFKEAERLKQVLSANIDHVAQIEGLHEDIDFRSKVSREDLESLCLDIFDRVPQPIFDALKMAEMDIEQVDTIILMGGATRTPKVQEKLQETVKGKELGKFLNTDEAIALGAVYQAAHLSKGFKVKKFMVKETTLFPISVDFHKESTSSEDTIRIIHRNLFSYRNPFPQKKVMTFSKHTKDFEFAVNYGDLRHLSEVQRSQFGELNISRVDLGGVQDAIKDNLVPEAEYKGVKAHFRLDESGIVSIDAAEVVVERIVEEEEEGTLSKIGNKIRGFFGGSDDDSKTNPVENENSDVKDAKPAETEETKDGKTDSPETKEPEKQKKDEEKPKKKDKKEEKTSKDKKGSDKKDTKDNTKTEGDDKAKNDTDGAKKDEPPKPKLVKVPVKLEKAYMDLPNITEDEVAESKKKLTTFLKQEEAKAKHEQAMNNLESFVFETRDKLEQEEYLKLTTKEERESYMTKLNEASQWLEETVDPSTPTMDLEGKYEDLKTLTKPMFDRHKESIERPRAVDALKQMLNYSNTFLSGMKNLTAELQIFTETEINTLEKTISETQVWFDEKTEAQTKIAGHETAAVSVRDLAEKINLLDREVKYLLNKARTTKPKMPKPATNTTEPNATKTDNTTTEPDLKEKEDTEEGKVEEEEPKVEEGKEEVEPEEEPEKEGEGKEETHEHDPTEL